MRVKLSVQKLKDALKALSKIKGKLVFDDIFIKTIGDITILSKSDMDTTLTISLEGISEENGQIVLPSEIVDMIKKLKDDYLTLTDECIKAGNKIIKLQDVQKNFTEETFRGDLLFTTAEKELHRMLEVKYAMAQDDVRPILKGIYFNGNETCALDGVRMSVRKGKYESNAKFVLNKNTVELLDSLLNNKSDDDVIVYGDEKLENIKFEIGNIEIIGKTLPGEFINYKSIIPDEHNYISSINLDNLKKELDFLSGIKTNYLKLNFTEDKLTLLTSQCKEVYDKEASEKKTKFLQETAYEEYKQKYNEWAAKKAKAEKAKKLFKLKPPKEKLIKPQKVYKYVPVAEIKAEVTCITEHMRDTEFTIAVNPKYLIEGVKTYSDKVEFRMTSKVSPIVVTQDGENLELILPIRVLD